MAILCGAVPALAQNYPSRLIRLVVPVAPGGVTDVVARITADYIGAQTGTQVVVENRAGAGGNVGVETVAKAPPDGYTLAIVNTGNIVINPFIYKQMPFDAHKDVTPVAPIGEAPQLLVVNAAFPAKGLREFIDLAKSQPGRITYGSAGAGSTPHLAADQFARLAGLQLVHVPYRGITPAVTDLVSGNINMVSVSAGPVIGFAEAGQLRILASATPKRLPYLPNVPTSAEAGLPGYEMTTWFALFAPSGTPKEIVDQLNGYIRSMLADPNSRKRLATTFVDPINMTASEFSAFVNAEFGKWQRIVQEAGLQAE